MCLVHGNNDICHINSKETSHKEHWRPCWKTESRSAFITYNSSSTWNKALITSQKGNLKSTAPSHNTLQPLFQEHCISPPKSLLLRISSHLGQLPIYGIGFPIFGTHQPIRTQLTNSFYQNSLQNSLHQSEVKMASLA